MADNQPVAQPDAAEPLAPEQDRTAGSQDAPVGLTQAQLNEIIAREKKQARLRVLAEVGDVEALRAKAAELDELKAAQMSEAEKLQAQLKQAQVEREQLQAQVEAERLNTLRLKVGTELGLSPLLSSRLQGVDDETIRADAQALIADVGLQTPARVPNLDATTGGGRKPPNARSAITPGEQAAARAAKMTDEEYIAARDKMSAAAPTKGA